MAQQTEKTPPKPSADAPTINGTMVDAYVQASQAILENTFTLNQEMMRFAGERFQADMAALQALSQCTNWQDMAGFQSDFTRSAAEAYQAEIAKLTARSTAAINAAWQPLQDTANTLAKGTGRS